MKKLHVLAVALLLGVAAVFGVVAATRTVGLGASAHAKISHTAIAARAKRLNAAERALRRALSDRPPSLPPVPAATRSVQAAAPQVVYRRPAPLVVIRHSQRNSEHESEHEAEGGDG